MPDSTEPTSPEGTWSWSFPRFTQAARLHGEGGGTGACPLPVLMLDPAVVRGCCGLGRGLQAPCYSQGASKGHTEGASKGHTKGVSMAHTEGVSAVTMRVFLRATPKVFRNITLSPWLGPFCSNHKLWKLCPTHSFKELDP